MGTLSRPVHQVFINFRGTLRGGFVSHLKDALERHKINYFIDENEERGRDLNYLFKRIKDSRVALVVLSIKYADSRWCLEELRTIMEKEEKGKIVVIPIFYKVSPEDVKNQEGAFGARFRRNLNKASREEMEKWQKDLKAVCNKMGITLKDYRTEAKLIKKVVKEVKKVLTTIERENNWVNKVKTLTVPLVLTLSWFGSAIRLIGAVLALLTETIQSNEGREDNMALPWSWLGFAVGLIDTVLASVPEAVQSDEEIEDNWVKKVITINVLVTLPWSWFGSAVGLIGAVLALLTETFQSDEGIKENWVKKVITFNIPVALPWSWYIWLCSWADWCSVGFTH